ncbi:uncharacterized protein LOC134071488 isoform X2 [Sardina pilchardus]|uniref:uncharacterized protein LOC134071488 isoform X2 n=1 Tax=Sardina pilchardus TaxID=27697 RepID=UPI002E1197D7
MAMRFVPVRLQTGAAASPSPFGTRQESSFNQGTSSVSPKAMPPCGRAASHYTRAGVESSRGSEKVPNFSDPNPEVQAQINQLNKPVKQDQQSIPQNGQTSGGPGNPPPLPPQMSTRPPASYSSNVSSNHLRDPRDLPYGTGRQDRPHRVPLNRNPLCNMRDGGGRTSGMRGGFRDPRQAFTRM